MPFQTSKLQEILTSRVLRKHGLFFLLLLLPLASFVSVHIGLGSKDDLRQVIETYNVTYIYVGSEELNNYPGCVARFDSIEWLEPVYGESLRIYKVAY
jgi:hypothetical protein